MIEGKLKIYKDSDDSHLIFDCPHCGGEHGLFVNSEKAYNNGQINIWKITVQGDMAEITPSWNNEKDCGWHGPNPWNVKLIPDPMIERVTDEV